MAVVTSAFSKSSVFAVHTNTLSRRFRIYPLWRAFSKSSFVGHRKRRFSVDGRPIRIKKVAFSNLSGFSSVDVALDADQVFPSFHVWNDRPFFHRKKL